MTHLHLGTPIPDAESKAEHRIELERLLAEFLANGGTIERITQNPKRVDTFTGYKIGRKAKTVETPPAEGVTE